MILETDCCDRVAVICSLAQVRINHGTRSLIGVVITQQPMKRPAGVHSQIVLKRPAMKKYSKVASMEPNSPDRYDSPDRKSCAWTSKRTASPQDFDHVAPKDMPRWRRSELRRLDRSDSLPGDALSTFIGETHWIYRETAKVLVMSSDIYMFPAMRNDREWFSTTFNILFVILSWGVFEYVCTECGAASVHVRRDPGSLCRSYPKLALSKYTLLPMCERHALSVLSARSSIDMCMFERIASKLLL